MSQRRTVLSSDPDARNMPSGEKATLITWSACPASVRIALPVSASQSTTEPFLYPLATRSPDGLHATARHCATGAHMGSARTPTPGIATPALATLSATVIGLA